MTKFKCHRCGWCCKHKRINITYSDIKRWEKEGRWDILKEVSFVDYSKHPNPDIRKTTGFYFAKTCKPTSEHPCPFLSMNDGLATCTIYETRPLVCRNNPELLLKEVNLKDWLGCPAFKEAIS